MERFDIANEKRHAAANGHVNGKVSPSESDTKQSSPTPDNDEPVGPAERPRKKQRTGKSESDAVLAARLQAEENGRARPTRGGSSRNSTRKKGGIVKKSPKKKKSAAKVNSDDDSAEGSDGEKKASKRGGAFNVNYSSLVPLCFALTQPGTLAALGTASSASW